MSRILSTGGCLQAHTQGEVEGSVLGRSPGPHLEGVQAQTWRCIPACTEADIPQQTATAVGGTHPTGMHSCLDLSLENKDIILNHVKYELHVIFPGAAELLLNPTESLYLSPPPLLALFLFFMPFC